MEMIYKALKADLAILKSNPPQLALTAFGLVSTGGWKNGTLKPYIYVQPPNDGIQDFDFLADRPTGPAPEAISPISAHHVMSPMPSWLKGVRIRSRSNTVEAMLTGAPSIG